MIKNPKRYTNEDTRDIHIQVSNDMYEKLNKMVRKGYIQNKTEYIKALIENDEKYKRG